MLHLVGPGSSSGWGVVLLTPPAGQLLTAAVEQLVSSTFTGFATWISELPSARYRPRRPTAIAVFRLGSLLSSRLLRDRSSISSCCCLSLIFDLQRSGVLIC